MPRRPLLALAVAVCTLASAAPAQAGKTRYAAPAGGGGDCTAAAPCDLARAVNASGGNDVLLVTPGTYSVSAPLNVNGTAVSGLSGAARPVLAGAANLNGSTLSADKGAEISDLEITASATGQDALTVKGGSVAERVIVRSTGGDGGKVVTGSPTTVLRDSVVTTSAGGSGMAGLKLRGTGGVLALLNVTLDARQGSAVGIRCEVRTPGAASIINTVALGAIDGIDASSSGSGSPNCSSENTFAGTTGTTGTLLGSVPSLLDPLLDGDLRPTASSRTIDAGRADALLGSYELDGGLRRTIGAAPDAGAYEYASIPQLVPDPVPAPDPVDTVDGTTATTTPLGIPTAIEKTDVPPARVPLVLTRDGKIVGAIADAQIAAELAKADPPRLGRTVVAGERAGEVLIKVPGGGTWKPMDGADTLPVGAVIDARNGAVTLKTALAGARTQTGTFAGGRFEVRQAARSRGMTDIVLRGGAFGSCAPADRVASTLLGRVTGFAAARQRPKKTVRRLWGQDKGGRFRTHGANSVATVRGTRWLTEDRCDGTRTRVVTGAVDVRAKGARKAKRVSAGRSILVRKVK